MNTTPDGRFYRCDECGNEGPAEAFGMAEGQAMVGRCGACGSYAITLAVHDHGPDSPEARRAMIRHARLRALATNNPTAHEREVREWFRREANGTLSGLLDGPDDFQVEDEVEVIAEDGEVTGAWVTCRVWVYPPEGLTTADPETDPFPQTKGQQLEWINRHAGWRGWAIFDTDRGYELERDDSMAVFDSDEDAWEHVWQRARRGSVLEARAMDWLRHFEPDEYQRIVRFCDGEPDLRPITTPLAPAPRLEP